MKILARMGIAAILVGIIWSAASTVTAIMQIDADATPIAFELCNTTFPGITNGTSVDPFSGVYASQAVQARATIADSMWMHVRENVWDEEMSLSSTCHTESPTEWWDTDEDFEVWYETQATCTDVCGGAAVGCTVWDFECCGWEDILAADMMVATDFGWGVVNQDTISDYLEITESCRSFENVWLHEEGHAYGVPHITSVISNMGTGGFCNKGIHFALGSSDVQWPVDIIEMQNRYEVAGGSTRQNFGASVYFRTTGGVDTRDGSTTLSVSSASPTANFTLNYSVNRYFDGADDSLAIQFRFVPSSSSPTYDWVNHDWDWPANTSSDVWDVDSSTASMAYIGGETEKRQFNFSISRTSLPAITTYRLWLLVDPGYAHTETDEGDNMIPTQFQVVRTN